MNAHERFGRKRLKRQAVSAPPLCRGESTPSYPSRAYDKAMQWTWEEDNGWYGAEQSWPSNAHWNPGNLSWPDMSKLQSRLPRPSKNGFVIIFWHSYVLIQVRSLQMEMMPGWFGVPGGQFDEGEENAAITAVREVKEESGYVLAPEQLTKFAEGKNNDWFAMNIPWSETPVIQEAIRDVHELGDTTPYEGRFKVAFPGHLWVPINAVDSLKRINKRKGIMGGLPERIQEAATVLGIEWR